MRVAALTLACLAGPAAFAAGAMDFDTLALEARQALRACLAD